MQGSWSTNSGAATQRQGRGPAEKDSCEGCRRRCDPVQGKTNLRTSSDGDFITSRPSGTSKSTIGNMKRQAKERKSRGARHVTEKGLISRPQKALFQLNGERKNSIQKWVKT